VESTVLSCLQDTPIVLRPGGVTVESLKELLGEVLVYKIDYQNAELEQVPTTPGMKYKHYSPDCEVVVVEFHGDAQNQHALIKFEARRLVELGKNVGILYIENNNGPEFENSIFFISLGITINDVARNLFSGLRALEEKGVDSIIVQGVSNENEGLAVMNRILKAASRTIK
jgi:L-threonylcarbamoyladenylate synthase